MNCRVDAIFEIVVSHLDEGETAKLIYETHEMKVAIKRRLLLENPNEFDTMRYGKTRKVKRRRDIFQREHQNRR